MRDLGVGKKILGMKIYRDRKKKMKKMALSQVDYIDKVLKCFSLENVKAISTHLPSHFKLTKEMFPKTQKEEDKISKVPYASAVGSFKHWNAVKWILRYLRGTSSKCLHFGGSTTDLQSYVESNLVGDIDTRWSTIGYVFTIGGAIVS